MLDILQERITPSARQLSGIREEYKQTFTKQLLGAKQLTYEVVSETSRSVLAATVPFDTEGGKRSDKELLIIEEQTFKNHCYC